MGDKFANISKAIRLIKSSSKNVFLSESLTYESKAMYNTKLNDFYNTVIKIQTNFSPMDLLDFIKKIEKQMGRTWTKERYSSRPIDIDILTYGGEIINSTELVIPHPHIKERKFVLKPWADIDSNYVLATTNKKISDLLMEITDNSRFLEVKK